MKNPLVKALACGLAFGALVFSASATVVFQDSFNYPNGPILTSAGSTAGGAWSPGFGNGIGGQIVISGNQVVIPGNGNADQPRAYFTNGLVYTTLPNYAFYTNSGTIYTNPYNASVAYFASNSPAAAIYASFTLNVPSGTGLASTYFAFFTDTNYDYRCRLYIVTNGAAAGNYRIGVTSYNAAVNASTNTVLTDLVPGNTYTVVMRYILYTGLSTLWINPATENTTDSTITASGGSTGFIGGGSPGTSVCAFGLRNSAGLLNLTIGNLIVGTTFADVVPSSAGSNVPFVALQPQDNTSAIVGDNVTFSTLAGGDPTLNYQWYSVISNVTNSVSGATGSNLVLNSVSSGQSGYYYANIANSAGSTNTRKAQLVVYTTPVAVVISNQPQNLTVNVGDTATFTVVAGGVPPPTYQWYYVTNTTAGVLKTNAIVGATSATLSLPNLNTNTLFTNLFVTAANRVNIVTSTPAILMVNPIQTVNISLLRSMVDGSFNPTNTTSIYTIQGTVTTWTNMTGSANTEFYLQDNTAGICVFWSGANSTNRPPGGAIVRVTAPLASFGGLLEIEPVFTNTLNSVKVISTNNPLPAAQPLPFDPNVTMAQLKAMESSYFVASNVTLSAGASFVSGVNEPITANASKVLTDPMFSLTFTNQQGAQFIMYLNAYTGIPGQAKPTGPVTIYGVLGYFTGTGFEFTPSRYSDVVSYIHLTNVLSNLTRPGDAPTNFYSENFLLPGGTLTTYASIGDPAGGNVTLTPLTTGLPAGAQWSQVTGGQTGTGTFTFTPGAADSGSNYVVNLAVTSTAGTAFTNTFTVYVPTTNEQGIAISEILANPTTNTSAPWFNPLQRFSDTTNVTLYDQYIEIANQSIADLGPGWTLDNGNQIKLLFDSNAGSGATIYSSNSLVIYGADGLAGPGLATPFAPSANGLALPTASSGLLVLRDSSGYIIDRVVYNPGDLNTNGSLVRFPTFNGPFVPQPFVGTNAVTPGAQYDGSAWNVPPQIPAGLGSIHTVKSGTNVVLTFSATANQVSTLWNASAVSGPYKVIYGQKFANTSGAFSNVISAPQQFYYITTQTNN